MHLKSSVHHHHWNKYWREFIVSAYPELARQYLAQQGFNNPTIEKFSGKTERLWELIPDNYAVIDVTVKGDTARDNKLELIQQVQSAQLVLYENQKKLKQNPEFAENIIKMKSLLNQRAQQ